MEHDPLPEMASEANDNAPSPGAGSSTWEATQGIVDKTVNPSYADIKLAIVRSDAAAHGLVTDSLGYEQVALVGIRHEVSHHVQNGHHLMALRYALDHACKWAFTVGYGSVFDAGIKTNSYHAGPQLPIFLYFKVTQSNNTAMADDTKCWVAGRILSLMRRYYRDRIFPETVWWTQDEADSEPTRQIFPWILEVPYVDPLDNYSNQACHSIGDQTNTFAALDNRPDEEGQPAMAEEDYRDLEEQFFNLPKE